MRKLIVITPAVKYSKRDIPLCWTILQLQEIRVRLQHTIIWIWIVKLNKLAEKNVSNHFYSSFYFYLPCNFVAQRLTGHNGDLLTHPFVGVEVTTQTGVILLDDDPWGLLHCLGPDSSLKRNHTQTWVTQHKWRTTTGEGKFSRMYCSL